jgi:hypothetical protein
MSDIFVVNLCTVVPISSPGLPEKLPTARFNYLFQLFCIIYLPFLVVYMGGGAVYKYIEIRKNVETSLGMAMLRLSWKLNLAWNGSMFGMLGERNFLTQNSASFLHTFGVFFYQIQGR